MTSLPYPEVALVVITDGRRDCISRAVGSMEENLRGPFVERFIVDDSGDYEYGDWLDAEYLGEFRVLHHLTRSGAVVLRSVRAGSQRRSPTTCGTPRMTSFTPSPST